MSVLAMIAALVAVLLLLSTLLWGIPWNRFTERSQKTRQVDPAALKRATIQVGTGALCSGFLLALLGLVAIFQLNTPTFTPMLLFIGFVVLPVAFAVLVLGMFLMKAATLKALFNAEKEA